MKFENFIGVRKIFYLLFFVLIFCPYLKAQDYDLGEVMVSAEKTDTYQAQAGTTTVVIGREELEKSGKFSVAQVLENVSGVNLTPTGYFGGAASVDIRGGRRGQTLVMIDGVEVYDPISVNKDFDFAHLSADNIERIEIVKGPQSTLYGSDAMAGVINIITKKGKGEPKTAFKLEAGSHNMFGEELSFSGAKSGFDFSAALSHRETDGISKARDGQDNDGYKNTSFSSRCGYELTDSLNMFLYLHYTDAEIDIDDGAYEDDPNRTNEWQMLSAKTGFEHRIDEQWKQTLEFSGISFNRVDSDPADSIDTTEDEYSRYRGDRKKIEWKHEISFSDKDTQIIGYEYEEERGASYATGAFWWSNAQADRRKAVDRAYYLNSRYEAWDDLFLEGGLRLDDYDSWGSELNYKLSSSYIIEATGTRVKTSYGTAFRAPNLYQLYDPTYGNTGLQPEKSRGFDAGFEQWMFKDRLFFGATYFYNHYKNLIDSDPSTWQFVNIKKGTSRGFEYETKLKVTDNFRVGGNYTYTKTRDESNAKEFGRRPKNQAAFYTDWDYCDKGNLYVIARYVGSRMDAPSYNDYKDKKYTVVDLTASYDINADLQLFGGVQNLFDREYEPIRGYNGLDREIFAGVKGVF